MKDIKNLGEKEINDKLQELKLELIKQKPGTKGAKSKTKEIKKAIARLLTTLTMNKLAVNKQKK